MPIEILLTTPCAASRRRTATRKSWARAMAGRRGRPKGRCGSAKANIFCSATFTAAAHALGPERRGHGRQGRHRQRNGMTRDRQGRLVVCHNFSRCVDRMEADGSITVIASSYRGYKLNRPNDVVVKFRRQHLFHRSAAASADAPEHTPEQDCAGVYRVSRDLTTINRVVSTFVNPNGCASRRTKRFSTSMTATRTGS